MRTKTIAGLIAINLGVGLSVVQVAGAGDVLRVQGAVVRWPAVQAGQTTTITYAALTSAYALPGGKSTLSPDNCGSMEKFGAIVSGSPHVSPEAANRALRTAFDVWERAANIRFIETDDVGSAMIVVGASASPKGRAFANISYLGVKGLATMAKGLGEHDANALSKSAAPSAERGDSIAEIDQAYICLNPQAHWKIGFDGNLEIYDLGHTFVHEIGHAIGLDHPGTTGAVMAYRYDEQVSSLQPPEIATAQLLYGPPVPAGER